MIRKKSRCYFMEKDKNCAESVLLSANDVYRLNAGEDTVKALGVFGGGLACGSICGAAAGACAAIGLKYSTGHAHASEDMGERVRGYMSEFQKEFDSELCKDIKPRYYTEEIRCCKVVEKSVNILEKYI